MSEQTLKLTPHNYAKLGAIHCGVTHEGFVVVGGDPHDIADDEEVVFEKTHIKATRHGNEYIFTRMS